MIELSLQYNSTKKWFREDSISVIGEAFVDRQYLTASTLAAHFLDCTTEAEFVKKLQALSGSFAVVIQHANSMFFAVDAIRTYPLFIFQQDDDVLVCDQIDEHKTWNEAEEHYFTKLFCTSENNTLLKNWKQLQAGEYGVLENQNQSISYSIKNWYIHKAQASIPFDKSTLQALEDELIYKIQTIAKDRTIIVPLSGGYDSRYLLALLHTHHIKNVICFTYGRKDSYEVTFARNTAEKLNYKWHFVEYDNELLDLFLQDEWNAYAAINHHYTSLPHEQDFFAVHYLKAQHLIPDNAIFMNGFCQDLHAGSIFEPGKRFDATQFVQGKYGITSALPFSSNNNDRNAYQQWFVQNRVSKFILNSVHVYAYFGYDFYLPFWDKNWIQFWYNLPMKERMQQSVYNAYIFAEYFKPFGIDFKKPNFDTTLSLYAIKKMAKKLLPESIVKAVQQQNNESQEKDVNNTHFLYEKLYRSIKNKPQKKNYKINELHALYFLERLKQGL